ncbi:hypothetical protein [Plasticicumulans sp.]|uniref:hypothetical protein n=1 Tax=Plasticicumulans sp. TaxID=2307179 RepID=UPI002BBDCC40|nr:hypothetical protein [Plasticicumulans sp.]
MQTSPGIASMSRHARVRQQQRGIPPLIVEWLLAYGSHEHDGHGATIRYFDRAARTRLGRAVGTEVVERLGDLCNSYAVVAHDGTVITTGHRYRRIHRI